MDFIDMIKESVGADKVTVVGGNEPTPAEPTPDDFSTPSPDSDSNPETPPAISFSTDELGDWGFGEEVKTKDGWIEKLGATREELKALRASSEKFNEAGYKSLQKDLQSQKEKVEKLMKAVNPLSHFSSEASYKREQLIKKFPNKNPQAISEIMGDKFDALDTMSLLKLNARFKYGDRGDAWLNSWIEEAYNVDLDADDFTVTPKMEGDAIDAKDNLLTVRNTEIPEIVDYQKELEKETEERTKTIEKSKIAWDPIVKKSIESLNKLTLNLPDKEGKSIPFEFNLDPKQLDGVQDLVLNQLASEGKEVNEDNLKNTMTSLQERLVLNNIFAIIKAHVGDQLAALDEEWANETNNPRKLNTQVNQSKEKTSTQLSKEQAEDAILANN